MDLILHKKKSSNSEKDNGGNNRYLHPARKSENRSMSWKWVTSLRDVEKLPYDIDGTGIYQPKFDIMQCARSSLDGRLENLGYVKQKRI